MPPKTMAFDERVAAHYEAWYETLEGWRADVLEKAVLGWLLESVPRASSVLEIGCGTGHFSRPLVRCGRAEAVAMVRRWRQSTHRVAYDPLSSRVALGTDAFVLGRIHRYGTGAVTFGGEGREEMTRKSMVWGWWRG